MTNTFLALWVGSHRLALRTTTVLGILSDEAPFGSLPGRVLFRARQLPYVDLRVVLSTPLGAARACVLALETRHGQMAIGVDKVAHVPLFTAPRLARMPPFGSKNANLIAALLRLPDRLVFVLDAEALMLHLRDQRPAR